jgi:adenine-specific DNA methylase
MSSKAKARKLIEVAMPIREVSTESVRDKSIRHGHISTLHLWWARRPLPVCRAVVFASLVPDPLDPACPPAFVAAVDQLLAGKEYKPYEDIPYTVITDKMEDNARNRLLCFIGRFSDELVAAEKLGKDVTSKKRLSDHSLIKWENKNNLRILTIARKLIYVAHNTEKDQGAAAGAMLRTYEQNYAAITTAEQALYDREDRHLPTSETDRLEQNLAAAIEHYLTEMPSVFDPFAGGGAIPLEAARLGCRSFGNDINPVAHIIQRASLEFPQRYGKPITFSRAEYERQYGAAAWNLRYQEGHTFGEKTKVDNRLSHDVAHYAHLLLERTKAKVGHLYPADLKGEEVIAYYWARTATCTNPTCGAQVPLLRQFYLSKAKGKYVSMIPQIEGTRINFKIVKGENNVEGWIKRGNLTCPICDNLTPVKQVKEQSIENQLSPRLIATIINTSEGKSYRLPTKEEHAIIESGTFTSDYPTEHMHRHSAGGDTFSWGVDKWGQMFSPRQITTLQTFVAELNAMKATWRADTGKLSDYQRALTTYLAVWLDRVAINNTTFGRWDVSREGLQNPYSRQAIAMIFDYPESNPFCTVTGSALNQLDWITRYLDSEGVHFNTTISNNASSGEVDQFAPKSLSAAVTDPPYYDAIAYADLSDFFYVWQKRTLGDVFPKNFATPQTPKAEECTALKHHHDNSYDDAKAHFEGKLRQIFTAIERQTDGVVSVMFAHQSTEAWTTLCNSVLGANMNITGSWAIDTEMSNRSIGLAGAALTSSVTVSCSPTEKIGYGDFQEIKREIEVVIAKQVKELYALGFRGADLLTACFGQAVSVFGRYKAVEKPNGDPVTVGELLDLAREMAFRSIINDVDTDEVTQFYLGWLASSGFAAADHDMVRKVTQIGLNIDTSRLDHYNILIADGNKQSLADSHQRFQANNNLGLKEDAPDIDRIHRLFRLLDNNNRPELLNFIHDNAPTTESPLWRVMNSLKELLPPDHDDGKIVATLLASQEVLLRDARERQETSTTQGQLDLK